MKKILTVLLSVLVAFAALSSASGCSSATLSGGYKYTLTPAEEVSAEELKAAAEVIENRLISACSKAEVKISDGKLAVRIPKIDKADEVMSLACEWGEIRFRDSLGNVMLSGTDVKNASAGYDENGNPAVFLEMTTLGTQRFAEATRKIANGENGAENVLCVYLGDVMIAAPKVTAEIPNGLATITDFESIERAKAFVAAIKSGSLSVGFNFARENT